jgi:LmbE family N-acetylglucosaminyl deacetylase
MVAAVLAGLLALAIGIVWLRVRRYRGIFRIASRRNDSCVCRGPHRVFAVSAASDGIELPNEAFGPGRSSFLAIDVSVTMTGRVFDPYLEIGRGSELYRQYFEQGANGVRYVNLSPAVQAAEDSGSTRIALRGGHLRWKPSASVMVFEPPAFGVGDTLVVAPHPDDSEIGAFGFYSGRPSWVVTVSSGEVSPTGLSPVVPRGPEQIRWRALLRVHDSLTTPGLGGVDSERCLTLVYPDTRLKQMHDEPTRVFALACESSLSRQTLRHKNPLARLRDATPDCKWSDLVEDLRWTLDHVRPRTLLCTHPLVDPHPDHVYTSVAVADALRAGAHAPELILLYVIHANEAPVYPFGGIDGIVSLPPWQHREWVADSIYSHPLSEDDRIAKYFAVEAAHDLRSYYSDSRVRDVRELAAIARRELGAFVTGMAPRPADFLRRAPRPNELYYVVSVEAFLELTRVAVEAHRAAQLSRSVARAG